MKNTQWIEETLLPGVTFNREDPAFQNASPLFRSVVVGDLREATERLARRADPNELVCGHSLLHVCAGLSGSKARHDIAMALIESGANPAIRNAEGFLAEELALARKAMEEKSLQGPQFGVVRSSELGDSWSARDHLGITDSEASIKWLGRIANKMSKERASCVVASLLERTENAPAASRPTPAPAADEPAAGM